MGGSLSFGSKKDYGTITAVNGVKRTYTITADDQKIYPAIAAAKVLVVKMQQYYATEALIDLVGKRVALPDFTVADKNAQAEREAAKEKEKATESRRRRRLCYNKETQPIVQRIRHWARRN